MINKVTLIGNLGRDPELRRLESGAAVANFSIATSENYQDRNGQWQTQTEWHDIVLWRNLAERAETQLRKGMLIYLEGKLSTRKWEDKDGNPRKTTEVVGNYVRILNRREDSDGSSYSGSSSGRPASSSGSSGQQQSTGNTAESEPAETSADDDLPF